MDEIKLKNEYIIIEKISDIKKNNSNQIRKKGKRLSSVSLFTFINKNK